MHDKKHQRIVTPKTTEQHLIVHNDKCEAYNKRLRSRYYTL